VICAFRRNPSDIALTLKPNYKNLAPFVRLQETGVEALEICHHCRSFTTNRQIFLEYLYLHVDGYDATSVTLVYHLFAQRQDSNACNVNKGIHTCRTECKYTS
jgi:hypothetical protein